ncbi:MAG TPA: prephenate dehydrogenase/arogenate dehydrogenase family protein [Clostridiales bacterium]|nr:prephenate dehydrogenase/arogenate dehydrogenase family protein [Clostridiales bacterium]
MTVGIVGLGLIGGSFAKAYREAGETVLACNRTEDTLKFAMLSGAVDGELTEENIGSCDLVIIAVFPEAAEAFLRRMAPHIGKKPVVIDACGTKRKICSMCFPIAEEYGFTYIGGHPMAGTHKSGFKYARANLFHNAPMVIVPPSFDDIELLDRVKTLLAPVGFGSISVTTAEKHDELIAFTSQMPHIISNAYIKSPTAAAHKGFSAGSYKDLTRVAWLNPKLWAELFLENRDCILNELDWFIAALEQYRDAVKNDDFETLEKLLDDGRRRKEEVDGR